MAYELLFQVPSSGLEPETSPLPRECSTAELQGLKKSGPGWTSQDCLQHSNSEVCTINLYGLSVAVKLFLGSAVTYLQSTFLFMNPYFFTLFNMNLK